jgi:hypothetical protein
MIFFAVPSDKKTLFLQDLPVDADDCDNRHDSEKQVGIDKPRADDIHIEKEEYGISRE